MTLVVGTFPRNSEGAEMVRYVANTIRPMFVKTGALWGEIKAPYVVGSVAHVDMRHTGLADLNMVPKESCSLQKEGTLEIGGARYWVAQERTRSQALRASGLRKAFSALKIIAREIGAVGSPALCSRSGGLYARNTLRIGKWGANEGQVVWNYTALGKLGVADEMVTRATLAAPEEAWSEKINVRREALLAARRTFP